MKKKGFTQLGPSVSFLLVFSPFYFFFSVYEFERKK